MLFPPPCGVGSFRVSATLTSGGNSLTGKPISFSVGTTALCAARYTGSTAGTPAIVLGNPKHH